MSLILIVLLVLLLCGGIGFSPIVGSNYGWGPSGIVGILVLILVLYLLGVI